MVNGTSTQPLILSLLTTVPICFSVLLFLSSADPSAGVEGPLLVPGTLSRAGQPRAPAAPGHPTRTSWDPGASTADPSAGGTSKLAAGGRPCLGAVEGGVRGGHQKESGSVGREEAEWDKSLKSLDFSVDVGLCLFTLPPLLSPSPPALNLSQHQGLFQ